MHMSECVHGNSRMMIFPPLEVLVLFAPVPVRCSYFGRQSVFFWHVQLYNQDDDDNDAESCMEVLRRQILERQKQHLHSVEGAKELDMKIETLNFAALKAKAVELGLSEPDLPQEQMN